jgi:lysine 2,3-aminomutase
MNKKYSIDKSPLSSVQEIFPVKITKYYDSLAQESLAIRRQCYPDLIETTNLTGGILDPNAETKYSVEARLIHKYPTKVAILVSNDCFTYCRHCTRKHYVLNKVLLKQKPDWNAIDSYLRKHPDITDVLLTGGDALFISNNELSKILDMLDKIENIKTIRIGTRAIVTSPDRIDLDLIKTLRGHKPIWIQTQFNHKDEITKESTEAVAELINNGFQINNQTVLLKDINDNEEALISLFSALIEIKVRPYYIYHCDNFAGASHFVTEYDKSRKLIENVASKLPGYAVPKYILDTPTKFGKICIESSHVKSFDNESIIFNRDGVDFVAKI